MSATITTPFGHAVPPAPRHAVTVHMPGWDNVERYGADPPSMIATFHNAYPRMKPHRDIVQLSKIVLNILGLEDHNCFLFSSLISATECLAFATSQTTEKGMKKDYIPRDLLHFHHFIAKDSFWVVAYPSEYMLVIRGFWSRPGVGISSRFAEANLACAAEVTELNISYTTDTRLGFQTVTHHDLRERIVHHLNRATEASNELQRPTSEDVYLFPSGMASIYKPHTYLTKFYHGTTVLFGMAFMDTVVALEEYGAGFKFFGMGVDDDLVALEAYLQLESENGRKVQAIWAEFPANPNLITPDLAGLRALADEYNVILAVDDTIASFANVDILRMTDILVTSLTKSFNGYADAIAGSAVLNPDSKHYSDLKTMFQQYHVPELYVDDAAALLKNNSDYLARTQKLNHNAKSIVDYLQICAEDPNSAVLRVHYPSINESGKYYRQFMRQHTADLTPGYGCLFSIELEDIPTTIAFYNHLNVHKSVHLGAPFTLAFAYTMCTYAKKLDWAAKFGLKPTQIRITAGLENTDLLLEDFRRAVEAANSARSKNSN